MADIKFLEAGTSASRGLEFFNSIALAGSAAITSDSGVTLASTRSLKVVVGAGESAQAIVRNVMADAGRRVSFFFRTPSSLGDNNFIFGLGEGLTGNPFLIEITSGGALKLSSSNGASTKSSAGSLFTASTNYIIQCCYAITSASNYTIKCYAAALGTTPTLILTVTNADFSLGATGATSFFVGGGSGGTGAATQYFDCLYIDDGNDQSSPGHVYVTPKLPAADSSINWDTAIGADPGSGNRYQAVDDRPWSTSTGRQQATSTQAAEEFTLQASNVGDVDLTGKTIVGYGAYVYARRQVAEFVNFIGEVQNKTSGASLVLNSFSNAVVSTGDTIKVSFAADTGMTTTPTIACVGATVTWTTEFDANNSGNVRTMQFRGEVTSGGTLTSITVSWTTSVTARAMQAGRYRFVGTTAATSANKTGNGGSMTTDALSVPAFGLIVGTGGVEDNTAPTAPNDNPIDSGIATSGGGAATNIGVIQAYELNPTAASVSTAIGTSFSGNLDYAGGGRAYNPLAGAGTEKIRANGGDASLVLTGQNAIHQAFVTTSTYPTGAFGVKSTGNAGDTFLYELGMHVAYTPASGTLFTQSVSGTVTSAATIVTQPRKVLNAAMSSAATVAKHASRAVVATLTPAAAVLKRTERSLAATSSTSSALVGVRIAVAILDATLDSAAALNRHIDRALAGTASSSGTVARQTSRTVTAFLSPTGAGNTQAQRSLAATNSIGATLASASVFYRALTADLSSSAAASAQTLRAIVATVPSSSALTRSAARSLAATIPSGTTLARMTSRALAGQVTAAAALVAASVFLKVLAGTLSMAAAISRHTSRFVAGSVPTAGESLRQTARALVASSTWSGALSRSSARLLLATSTSTAAIVKRTAKTGTATVGAAGAVVRQCRRALAGTVSSAASVARVTSRALARSISVAAAVAKRTSATLSALATASAALTSSMAGAFHTKALDAMLAVEAVLSKRTDRALAAQVTVSGTLARLTRRALDAILDLVGGAWRSLNISTTTVVSLGPKRETSLALLASRDITAAEPGVLATASLNPNRDTRSLAPRRGIKAWP